MQKNFNPFEKIILLLISILFVMGMITIVMVKIKILLKK